MAISVSIICSDCKKPANVWVGGGKEPPDICTVCEENVAMNRRSKYLSALQKLSVKQRLENIERWIYDYNPPVNPRDMKF